MSKKVLLCILDGFAIGDPFYEYNAVFRAKTPNIQRILKEYPYIQIATSGTAVGLPEGQMGNSEVGHMTIGSGRVIYQDLPKISMAIESGEMKNKLACAIEYLKNNPNNAVHIVGLCSNGGVHSHIDHIIAICKIFEDASVKYNLHAISDGRDVPPQEFIKDVLTLPNPSSISGRYYTMDRDNRAERTALGLDSIFGGAQKADDFTATIQQSYNEGITDEFIKPFCNADYKGVKEGDIVLMANFRSDRMRQITKAIIDSAKFAKVMCMTPYSNEIVSRSEVLFPKEEITETLSEVLSKHNKKHVHIAETEKYAHVTFFLNGGREEPFSLEERILVPSPKVATYDLQPEMSIDLVCENILDTMRKNDADVIITNIANGDMVGHTGNFEAAKKAAESIDALLAKLEPACKQSGYTLIITADHGNLEEMMDHSGQIHTQHTTGPVPFIVCDEKAKFTQQHGTLADVSPTILKMMDITPPKAMTGKALIEIS